MERAMGSRWFREMISASCFLPGGEWNSSGSLPSWISLKPRSWTARQAASTSARAVVLRKTPTSVSGMVVGVFLLGGDALELFQALEDVGAGVGQRFDGVVSLDGVGLEDDGLGPAELEQEGEGLVGAGGAFAEALAGADEAGGLRWEAVLDVDADELGVEGFEGVEGVVGGVRDEVAAVVVDLDGGIEAVEEREELGGGFLAGLEADG